VLKIECIKGSVERVTYHNQDNGFCVLRVQIKGFRDLVTIVGNISNINAGEFISASGLWIHDRQHGTQFKAPYASS
jgi:exodeoxyribonuclease V alpha subunit